MPEDGGQVGRHCPIPFPLVVRVWRTYAWAEYLKVLDATGRHDPTPNLRGGKESLFWPAVGRVTPNPADGGWLDRSVRGRYAFSRRTAFSMREGYE